MAYADHLVVCSNWITADRLCCEGVGTVNNCDGTSTPLVYEWTDDEYIQAASNILYARTCYRYPGVCQKTVRPCLGCCSSCSGPCGCGAEYNAIELVSDAPILSIVSVTINGTPVDPLNYRLDEDARIVRTDGDKWPTSNNLGLTNYMTNGDDVVVVYETGRPIPTELQMACSELACELKKACNGDSSCTLPSHVKSVTRRGVEYDINDLQVMLLNGYTGNPIIDYAISRYGNCPKSSMYDPTRTHRNVRG